MSAKLLAAASVAGLLLTPALAAQPSKAPAISLTFDPLTAFTPAAADPKLLAEKLGKLGMHFYTLAQAQDPRRVEGRRASKSIGSENTLARDVRAKGANTVSSDRFLVPARR